MANKKQLAILKQGVAAWNKWREENPDAKIDLSWAKLEGFDLRSINLYKAKLHNMRIKNIDFSESNFNQADLSYSFLYNTSLCRVGLKNTNLTRTVFKECNFNETILYDESVRLLIEREDANYDLSDFDSLWSRSIFEGKKLDFCKIFNISCDYTFEDTFSVSLMIHNRGKLTIFLRGKDLRCSHLVKFNLRDTDLRETDLRQANLSSADITGAKLWGSARENWIIDGIRCDYVYWDEAGEQRIPPDRDFRPGEFEELYKQVPTFEYVFANGFTPLDPLIMDRVVQAVNEQHKEFSLELVNFDKRGQPHATFTVCRLDYVEKARKSVTEIYEKTIEYLMQENEEKNRLIERQNNFIDQLIKKTPSIEDLKQMGDTYNNYGQTGAMGKNASASGNTFQQITADLSRVHEEMQRSAKTPKQRAAADDVAKAAQAAQQQNEPAVRQHLKNAGKFALDCAQKIGAEALAEYLKKMTLGL